MRPKCLCEAARRSLTALELARAAALEGRADAASDAGTAALLARAGIEGAALNVLIDLEALEDETFVRACRVEVDRLRALARQICDEILATIYGRFEAGKQGQKTGDGFGDRGPQTEDGRP